MIRMLRRIAMYRYHGLDHDDDVACSMFECSLHFLANSNACAYYLILSAASTWTKGRVTIDGEPIDASRRGR